MPRKKLLKRRFFKRVQFDNEKQHKTVMKYCQNKGLTVQGLLIGYIRKIEVLQDGKQKELFEK
jgi:hypothetical protein